MNEMDDSMTHDWIAEAAEACGNGDFEATEVAARVSLAQAFHRIATALEAGQWIAATLESTDADEVTTAAEITDLKHRVDELEQLWRRDSRRVDRHAGTLDAHAASIKTLAEPVDAELRRHIAAAGKFAGEHGARLDELEETQRAIADEVLSEQALRRGEEIEAMRARVDYLDQYAPADLPALLASLSARIDRVEQSVDVDVEGVAQAIISISSQRSRLVYQRWKDAEARFRSAMRALDSAHCLGVLENTEAEAMYLELKKEVPGE